MIKKLTKTGNSLALVLDKPLLERCHLDADTPVEVSTDGRVIIVSPVPDKKRMARIKEASDEIEREYSDVFRRLAE
jgi:antitoxin component of MazEF toxin-antitoxin module